MKEEHIFPKWWLNTEWFKMMVLIHSSQCILLILGIHCLWKLPLERIFLLEKSFLDDIGDVCSHTCPPTEEIKCSEVLLNSLLSVVEIKFMHCSNPFFEAQTFVQSRDHPLESTHRDFSPLSEDKLLLTLSEVTDLGLPCWHTRLDSGIFRCRFLRLNSCSSGSLFVCHF